MIAALVGKVVVAVAGLLTVAIMTRHLGAANYGILKIAQTFVLFAGALAHLGLHQVMVREVAIHEDRAASIIGAALGARMACATVLLAAAALIAALTPWNATVLLAIVLASIGMVAYQGNEVVNAVLQWRLSQGRAMLAEVTGTAAVLLGTALTAYIGLGVLTMTAVSTAGLVITFLVALYLVNQLTLVRPLADRHEWRRLIHAGLPLGISSYLAIISLRGDVLLLSLLKPAADVGLYAVASKIYEVSLQLPVIFAGLLMPVFARAASDPPVLREQLTQALHVMVVVGIGIVLALGFFSDEIVLLLAGPKFAPSARAVQLTGASVALAGYSFVLRYAAIAQERQRELLLADVVITISALLAYLLLIPWLSFIGAALGTLAAEVVAIGCLLFVVSRGLDKLPWSNLTGRALMAGLLTAVAISLMERSQWPVLLELVAGVLIYCSLLFLTGALSTTMLKAVLAPGTQH